LFLAGLAGLAASLQTTFVPGAHTMLAMRRVLKRTPTLVVED
jgi:hypothetical protein